MLDLSGRYASVRTIIIASLLHRTLARTLQTAGRSDLMTHVRSIRWTGGQTIRIRVDMPLAMTEIMRYHEEIEIECTQVLHTHAGLQCDQVRLGFR